MSSEPTTEAGRDVLDQLRPVFGTDLPKWTAAILAIEAEAAYRADLADRIGKLPQFDDGSDLGVRVRIAYSPDDFLRLLTDGAEPPAGAKP